MKLVCVRLLGSSAWLLLAALLIGCGVKAEVNRLPDVEGMVTAVTNERTGSYSLLVEGDGTAAAIAHQAQVTLNATTRVFLSVDTEFLGASLRDIAPGDRVRIYFTNPSAAENPAAQGTAARVEIIK